MGRIICCLCTCLAVGLVGCGSFSKLVSSKPKFGSGSNDQAATTSVGSPDLSTSNKLKDPTKIHLAYAGWHEQSGNYPEARKSYLKVLEKSPKDTEAMLGLARIDRAFGREEEADKQLKKALKYHPKDPKVLVAIGQVHASRNEWPEAMELMTAAHKLAPYETIYQYHLAVVEARSGEIQPALEHFTRSVGLAEAHCNLGFILNEQGRTSEAEVHLRKALQLKPDLKQAEATLASIRTSTADKVQPASFSNR